MKQQRISHFFRPDKPYDYEFRFGETPQYMSNRGATMYDEVDSYGMEHAAQVRPKQYRQHEGNIRNQCGSEYYSEKIPYHMDKLQQKESNCYYQAEPRESQGTYVRDNYQHKRELTISIELLQCKECTEIATVQWKIVVQYEICTEIATMVTLVIFQKIIAIEVDNLNRKLREGQRIMSEEIGLNLLSLTVHIMNDRYLIVCFSKLPR